MKINIFYIISLFICQKKEPEPTQKNRLRGSRSNFKSAPAPGKNLGSGSATLLANNKRIINKN